MNQASGDPTQDLYSATLMFRSGRLDEAAALCERVLAARPQSLDALRMLAIVRCQQGRLEDGVALFERALQVSPRQADVCNDLGNALRMLGRTADAQKRYERALKIQPNYPEAHYNLGNVLTELGRAREALASFDRALALRPDYVEAHINRGNALARSGRHAEALSAFDRAIALRRDHADARFNRANSLVALGRHAEAVQGFEEAIALRPQHLDAHVNRASALGLAGRIDEAIASCDAILAALPDHATTHLVRANLLARAEREQDALAAYDRAIALAPQLAAAHMNRANVLVVLERIDEALAGYRHAVELAPDDADAHNNLANLLRELRRFDEAATHFDQALRLRPDHAEARYSKAELLLLQGDHADGWRMAEARWASSFRTPHGFTQPLWLGDRPLAGRSVLVHPEVGFGDDIMFARYLPRLAQRGAQVTFITRPALLDLFATLEGGCTLLPQGEVPPACELQCPTMSLPLAFGTNADTIPADIPYLHADPARRERWRARLGAATGLRVGVVWSGQANRSIDRNPLRRRSVGLERLAPLLALPAEFHALQKEFLPGEAERLDDFPRLQTHAEALVDFADTAALVAEMDLVISIDTSVAHLAGALGTETWVLLPVGADYRWGAAGERTPWYPTARLFRQPAPLDWASVVEQVRATLAERIGRQG